MDWASPTPLGVNPARHPATAVYCAHLIVRTHDYAFIVSLTLTPPARPLLVELRGPSGDTWS